MARKSKSIPKPKPRLKSSGKRKGRKPSKPSKPSKSSKPVIIDLQPTPSGGSYTCPGCKSIISKHVPAACPDCKADLTGTRQYQEQGAKRKELPK